MATYKDLASRLAPIGLNVVLPAVPEYTLPAITLEPTGAEIRNGNASAWETCTISVRYPLAQNNVGQFEACQRDAYAVFAQLIGSPFIVGAAALFAAPDLDHPAMLYAFDCTFPGPYSICDRLPSTEPDPEE